MTASASVSDTQRLRALGGPPSDVHEYLGQVMTQTARTARKVDELDTTVRGIATELRGMRDDLDHDRKSLVHGAATKASAHASNRMAGLLGALFVLYTESAPYLHELWRMFHK